MSDTALARPVEGFFTPEQEQLIRDSFLNGASKDEAAVLLEVARARKLNPITKQIHFVKRWDSMKGREVWSYQTSIDGLRAIAERTGLYAGQDEPELLFEGKQLVGARVKVYRKDWPRPMPAVAWWHEFVPINTKTGQPTRMWQQMPRLMLAKCAEALALRKAFPEETGGLYIAEEMQQAEAEQPKGGRRPGEAPPPKAPPEDAQIINPSAADGGSATTAAAAPADPPHAEPPAAPPPISSPPSQNSESPSAPVIGAAVTSGAPPAAEAEDPRLEMIREHCKESSPTQTYLNAVTALVNALPFKLRKPFMATGGPYTALRDRWIAQGRRP